LFPSKPVTQGESEFSATSLPNVSKGGDVHCQQADLKENQTTPPKYFTNATFLSAMTGIARYVTDAFIKKVLRDTDVLGIEATRAKEVGTQLICSLPVRMTIPRLGVPA
jgi:DNA topoisomerase-3